MRSRIEQKIETLASNAPPAGQAATGGLNAMRSARGLTTWEVGPGADLTLRLSTGRPKTSPLGVS